MTDITSVMRQNKINGLLSSTSEESVISSQKVSGDVSQTRVTGTLGHNALSGSINGQYLNRADFVPYVNAARDVDLGVYNLTTSGWITAANLLNKLGLAGGQTIYFGTQATDNGYLYSSNNAFRQLIYLNSLNAYFDRDGNVKLNSLGLGTATPDPINYYLYIKSAITAALKFEAGTGFALLTLARSGVNVGYFGMGSASSNAIGFGTYDLGVDTGSVDIATKSVMRMRIDANGVMWYGYAQSDDFFSIGLDPSLPADAPAARLHIMDGRDGSTNRDAVVIDTRSGWSSLSTLTKWKMAGVMKAAVGINGKFYQYKSPAVVTTDTTPKELFRFTLEENRRYHLKIDILGKQGGNANMGDFVLEFSAKRYIPGTAVIIYDAVRYPDGKVYSAGEDIANWDAYATTSGNDVIIWVKQGSGGSVGWQGWLTYSINTG